MKGSLTIFGIVVILSTVGLSGCLTNDSNSVQNRFQGSWRGNMRFCEEIGGFTMLYYITFTDYNGLYMELTMYTSTGEEVIESTKSGTYETEGDKIFITSEGQVFSFAYHFGTVESQGKEIETLYLDDSPFFKE